MNRTKKFMYNTVASVFQQMVIIAAGLILPRVMLVFYGSEINGITSSIRQFINYFTLVEAGIGASAIFALYKPLAREDHNAISSIVTAARRFYIQSGYLFTALIVILAFCFPFIRSTKALSSFEFRILVVVLGAHGFLNFFFLSKYSVILTADQRSYVISIATSVSNVISTVVIVTLAYLGVDVVLARSLSLFSLLAQSLILFFYVRKKYHYLDYNAVPDNSAMAKRWDALYLQILGIVQIGAPVIMTTIFLDYRAVSVYSIFYMVIGGINGLLSIFTSGLSASFGDVIARRETKTLQKTYQEFECTYYAMITVVYACALVLIMPFVRIYTAGITDANYNVPVLGYLMVINGFLYNLKTPQGMLVVSAGLYRETRRQTTIQGAISVLGEMILAPFFGLSGIIIGSILSNLYRDIDLLFFIPKHVTKLSPIGTLKRWGISFLVFFLILLPAVKITIRAYNLLHWIFWGIGWCVYATATAVLFGMLMDREAFKASVNRMIRMIGVR